MVKYFQMCIKFHIFINYISQISIILRVFKYFGLEPMFNSQSGLETIEPQEPALEQPNSTESKISDFASGMSVDNQFRYTKPASLGSLPSILRNSGSFAGMSVDNTLLYTKPELAKFIRLSEGKK